MVQHARLVTRSTLGLVVALASCLVSCQGNGSSTTASNTEQLDDAKPNANSDATAPDEKKNDGSAAPIDKEPSANTDLPAGAIHAWDAVIWRNQYLARRKQTGTIVGVVGKPFVPPIAPAVESSLGSAGSAAIAPPRTPNNLTWLIDTSSGHGSLGVRVLFGTGEPPAVGSRVAVTGAWLLDSEKQWYWLALKVAPLPALPPNDLKLPPSEPGLTISSGPAPSGARMVSLARDNDVVYFQVVGVPKRQGDGWKVADELGNPAVGTIYLPGEAASYGSLDMRTPDERWTLRRGVTYWLKIGRLRRSTPTSPWQANARTAPVREM